MTSTISGPTALGMIWRSRMWAGPKPMDCAASTYSMERCEITRLRESRANFGHHTTSIAMTVFTVPIPSAAAIAIARMIGGKQKTRSVSRIRPSSAQPRA